MFSQLKIWIVIALLLLALIIFRIELIGGGLKLLLYFFASLINDPKDVLALLDFPTTDLIFSVILILILPFLLFKLKNKWEILNNRISFISFCILMISINFIFAPIITDYHPNYQGSLKVTRFLKPFQSVKRIYLKNNSNHDKIDGIRDIKNAVVRSAVNDRTIFFDSIEVNHDSVVLYQSGVVIQVQREKVRFIEGEPKTDSKTFYFGTDELGRDIFSRIIYGSRISIIIGLFSVFIALMLGLLLGFIAGYYGGYYDLVISRITDMFMTVPSIFFVIMALAFFGNSLVSIIIVLGFSGWMSLSKIVKGEIVLIKKKDYFITAKKLMLPKRSLLFKEILPVIIVPVVVNIVFQFSNVILAESSLSYLGLGSGLNYPSWGSMILSGQHYMSQGWWLMVFPGVALIITLLTFNQFGDKIKSHYNHTEN